jgi:hypothetical protein
MKRPGRELEIDMITGGRRILRADSVMPGVIWGPIWMNNQTWKSETVRAARKLL